MDIWNKTVCRNNFYEILIYDAKWTKMANPTHTYTHIYTNTDFHTFSVWALNLKKYVYTYIYTHTHILGSQETRKENNGHKKQKVNAKYWGIGQLQATRKKNCLFRKKIFQVNMQMSLESILTFEISCFSWEVLQISAVFV